MTQATTVRMPDDFFFNVTPTTEIYTLSLYDALTISERRPSRLTRRAFETRVPDRNEPPKERSEEHTSELQSHSDLVCRLLLEKKKHLELPAACESLPQQVARRRPDLRHL